MMYTISCCEILFITIHNIDPRPQIAILRSCGLLPNQKPVAVGGGDQICYNESNG